MKPSAVKEVSEFLKKEGFKDLSEKIVLRKLESPIDVTRFINLNVVLKTNQWDKILGIIND